MCVDTTALHRWLFDAWIIYTSPLTLLTDLTHTKTVCSGAKIRLKRLKKQPVSITTTFQSLESYCLGRCSKDRKCSGTDQNIWFNKLYHHICCICLLVHYTPLYSCVQCCCFSPKPLTRKPNFCYWTPKKCQLSQIMQTCKTLCCVSNQRHFFWLF